MNPFVLLSGCSGGGKSTLLSELQNRGYTVIQEPGRRIVQEQLTSGGSALPWLDMEAFLNEAIKTAQDDYCSAPKDGGWVFFDRGLIDAAAALQELKGTPLLDELNKTSPYHSQVFLTPPWPEIYEADPERRHDMNAALREYERLKRVYPLLGYQVSLLPKTSVEKRADFVLKTLTQV
ncbi:MAG: AAA family ATPase [Alcaligenes nematophilus]|uniref:AAA family ATPase n=1 Tax=Alcaligenes TaxID=507 RepID=UPI00352D050D